MERKQASIHEILEKQRVFFGTHRTKDVEFRIEQLKGLKAAILAYEGKITKALYNDLHRSEAEAYSTEIAEIPQLTFQTAGNEVE